VSLCNNFSGLQWTRKLKSDSVGLQRNDIATANTKYNQFDFLNDIVPREEIKLNRMEDDSGPGDLCRDQHYLKVMQHYEKMLQPPQHQLKVLQHYQKMLQGSTTSVQEAADGEGDALSAAAPPHLQDVEPPEEQRALRPQGSVAAAAAWRSESLFACDACDESFSRKSELQTHINAVHDGVRKFVCDACD